MRFNLFFLLILLFECNDNFIFVYRPIISESPLYGNHCNIKKMSIQLIVIHNPTNIWFSNSLNRPKNIIDVLLILVLPRTSNFLNIYI